MHTIKFRARADENGILRAPNFTRSHCDMNAMRQHPTLGAYANSDMFPQILARLRSHLFGEYGRLDLANPPEGVTVSEGFLKTVVIAVPEDYNWRKVASTVTA